MTMSIPRTARLALAGAAIGLLTGAGCRSDITTGGFLNKVTVNVTRAGAGAGRVEYQLPGEPVGECDLPATSTDTTFSCFDFEDAGAGGSVRLTAVPNAGSIVGAWTRCDQVTGPICDVGFDNAPATLNPIVRFDLEAENSCPNITVPPFNTLTLTTGPRPGPATPVPNDTAAWTGTNYLVNGDFEQPVFAGGIPTATGYWAFDQAWSAPTAQQGITAQSGSRLLHFVSSSPDGTASAVGTASEQVQLVDVSALRTLIDSGQVEVEARAFFNRVAAGGCARIDNAFGIRVSAHAGIPTNVNVDLGTAQGNVTADDDPAGWQAGSAVLTLPVGTTHVAVRVFINEGAANNDPAYPEFHGHYADNSSLTVRLKP